MYTKITIHKDNQEVYNGMIDTFGLHQYGPTPLDTVNVFFIRDRKKSTKPHIESLVKEAQPCDIFMEYRGCRPNVDVACTLTGCSYSEEEGEIVYKEKDIRKTLRTT